MFCKLFHLDIGHLSMPANICPPFNQTYNTGYFSQAVRSSSESSFSLKGSYHLSIFSFRDS